MAQINKKSTAEQAKVHDSSLDEEDASHGEGGHDESNWLVSYADMMTILCGFFIMLYSMAKVDEPKYDSFKEAISKYFGGEYVSQTKDLTKFATEVIQQYGLDTKAVIKSDSNGVSIIFESTIFFETLSSDVSQQGTSILDLLIKKIAERQNTLGKSYKIVIEGHTDSRPVVTGIYPSNWELSGARAARVVRMFLDHGFSPKQMTAIGYADTHPQVESKSSQGTWNETALAKNRRVVLRILEPNIDSIPFPDHSSIQATHEKETPSPSPSPSIPSANNTH